MHRTWSPFSSSNVVRVESVPAAAPLICHSKVERLPPNNGDEFMVTKSPAHMFVPAAMLIDISGVSKLRTATSIELLVAVDGLGQFSLLVRTTVTTSPSLSAEVVKAEVSVPAFVPFTFHW